MSKQARQLGAAERALAERMGGAFFSLFRHGGRHDAAGVWLEDLLARDRRLWLMDEAIETAVTGDEIVDMRVLDAGPFHAGFGIVVRPDEETIDTCRHVRTRDGRLPFRHSLAATVYGDTLRPSLALGQEQIDILETLLEGLGADAGRDRTAAGRKRTGR